MTFKNRSCTSLVAMTTLSLLVTLSGCAPIVIGGVAAGAALVATDRRTSGIQLEDKNIDLKIQRTLSKQFGEEAKISGHAYNGQVLLTGEAHTATIKAQATTLVKSIENVKTVHNEIMVGPIASFKARSTDTWITSKVRSALLNTKYVPSSAIAVHTSHGVVYLQGKVTHKEGEYAATAAASVNGVSRVVKLFEIISREEAIRLSRSTTTSAASPNHDTPLAVTDQTDSNSNTDVQAIPLQ